MDTNCIFCRIVKKEVPAEIVYEDKSFLAFLDINPRAPGHLQVIPKKHYRWVWDVENSGDYFATVKKLALILQKVFGEESVWSRITGDEVEHAHIWIFPDPKQTKGDKKDFQKNSERIKGSLVR